MTAASAATVAPGATCPEHPRFPPVGTCERCGRFVCGRCPMWGNYCAACEHRRLEVPRTTASRAYWTRWALGANALLAALGASLHGWLVLRLEGGLAASDEAALHARLFTLLTVAELALFVLPALLFLRWLHLAVRTAKVLGLEPGTSPGWAVGWWFIPLAHLWDPYLVVQGLWQCLGGSKPRGAAISAWWTAWVLGGIARIVEVRMFGLLATNPFHASSALLSGFLAELLFALSALLCIRVVGQVQALLIEHMEEVADAA